MAMKFDLRKRYDVVSC